MELQISLTAYSCGYCHLTAIHYACFKGCIVAPSAAPVCAIQPQHIHIFLQVYDYSVVEPAPANVNLFLETCSHCCRSLTSLLWCGLLIAICADIYVMTWKTLVQYCSFKDFGLAMELLGLELRQVNAMS